MTANAKILDFNKWGPQSELAPAAGDPVELFIKAIQQRTGGAPSLEEITPGKMIRFATSDRRGDESGWCKLFEDGEGGIFGCWRQDISETWQVRQPRTPEEKASFQLRVKQAREESSRLLEQERTACREKSAEMWGTASEPSDHPYLIAKGIQPNGARQVDNMLLVPVWDIDGTLHGLQRIFPDGDKKFLLSTAKKGHFFTIGEPGDTNLICEGYATACTLHQTTGHFVIVAFDKGNLKSVAEVWRVKLPNAKIIICADDDHTTEGNPGITKATEAANAVQGKVVIPNFPTTRGPKDTDFNDLANLAGAESVKACIAEAGEPKKLSAREKLSALVVRKEYVKMVGNELWFFKYLIIKNQIVVFIAKSGGGKTTISFNFLAPYLINTHGLTVYYFDCDSPASDHARMLKLTEETGPKFQWINPLTHGKGPAEIVAILKEFVASGERLDDAIFFFDTLKKFIDMLDKKSVKPFFVLMRQLAALGATIVLLGHANKHRDNGGCLIFEGVGDVLSDADALILFERISSADGSVDITTVIDPDKGAKVRSLYKSVSFHIAPDRTVTLNAALVPVPDWSPGGAKKDKLTVEEITEKIRDFLREMGNPVSQTIVVDSIKDKLPGTGILRIRNVLNTCAVLQTDATTPGQIYYYTSGLYNRKVYGVTE